MNIMLLPGVNNKLMLDTLRNYYITEEFMGYMARVADVTSPMASRHEVTQLILLTLNKLLLINTYRYVERDDLSLLMRLLNNRNLHMDLVIPVYILSEIVELTMGDNLTAPEVFEAQCMLIRVITDLVGDIQTSRPDDFAQAHVQLVEGFTTYIPLGQISVSRIDFTPSLVPMVFYEKLNERKSGETVYGYGA